MGKPLGTVFVELDMDATKFSAAQKRIIKDAGVVTKEVERNYSTLGIKSSAMYEAMRLQAENAYQGILHSSRSTANDLVRAEQAKAAKITAINEQQFGKQVSMMGQLKSNWLGIAAAIASLSSVFAIGKSVLQLGDDIAKASEKLGIGAEKLSAMKYAAELSDVSFEALQKGMKKFSQAITEAEGKGSDAATAFSAMGIATKDAHGKTLPLDTLFGKVADRFAAMEDGAGKVSLAVALFGRAGMDMIPVLNKGAAGMAAMEAEAVRLGATISGKTAKQLEEANDNLKSMWLSVKGITASITGGLLGAVKRMGDAFGESLAGADVGGFAFSSAAKTFKAPAAPGKIAAPSLAAINAAAEARKKIEDEYQKIHAANVMAEGKIVHDNLADEMGWSQEYYDAVTKMRVSEFEDWKKQQAEEAALLEKFDLEKIHGLKELQDAQRAEFEDTGTPMAAYTVEDAFKTAEAYGNVSLAIDQINAGWGEQNRLLEESKNKIANYIEMYANMGSFAAAQFGSMSDSMMKFYAASGKKHKEFFKLYQAMAIGEALISTYAGIARAFKDYQWPYSMIVAAVVGAAGLAQVANISSQSPAAHGGLDYVPAETTYLLDKGERVISPKQNKDLTDFLGGGGGGQGQTINLFMDREVICRVVHKGVRTGDLNLVLA